MKKISKGVFLAAAGGIVLVLQAFGIKIDAPYVNEIIEALCAVLVVLGIVTTAKSEDAAEENDSGADGSEENPPIHKDGESKE